MVVTILEEGAGTTVGEGRVEGPGEQVASILQVGALPGRPSDEGGVERRQAVHRRQQLLVSRGRRSHSTTAGPVSTGARVTRRAVPRGCADALRLPGSEASALSRLGSGPVAHGCVGWACST